LYFNSSNAMRTLFSTLRLFLFTLLVFGVLYPALILGIGTLVPERAAGSPVYHRGKLVGFANVGQAFAASHYFHGRPSAVGYNAAATGGSNKGPTNPDHLAAVKAARDTFWVQNPGTSAIAIPSLLLTASGSGIDPHLTPYAAHLQAARIAKARGAKTGQIEALIAQNTVEPLLGLYGLAVVNVLELNLALDQKFPLKSQK
jgi:K+-transporting ATPase ATPase C chain